MEVAVFQSIEFWKVELGEDNRLPEQPGFQVQEALSNRIN